MGCALSDEGRGRCTAALKETAGRSAAALIRLAHERIGVALLTAADQAALTAAFAPAGKSLYAEPGIIARIRGNPLALLPN